MSHRDEELDDDERDDDGYVHELRCDDGKKRHRLMDGQHRNLQNLYNLTIYVVNEDPIYQIPQLIYFGCMTNLIAHWNYLLFFNPNVT